MARRKRVRQMRSDVTWAFPNSLEPKRNLCDHCQVFNGPNCPRKTSLPKNYPTMVATRCIFFREAVSS